jgi:hypothetical protein
LRAAAIASRGACPRRVLRRNGQSIKNPDAGSSPRSWRTQEQDSAIDCLPNAAGPIRLEDLFRYAGPGVRSFSANPCGREPSAFFSVSAGATNLNAFNNCNNGGDYGDRITHTPGQVQDAIGNGSASPSLNAGASKFVALDVVGLTLTSAAPEPGAYALFALGLSALGGTRLRRDQR